VPSSGFDSIVAVAFDRVDVAPFVPLHDADMVDALGGSSVDGEEVCFVYRGSGSSW